VLKENYIYYLCIFYYGGKMIVPTHDKISLKKQLGYCGMKSLDVKQCSGECLNLFTHELNKDLKCKHFKKKGAWAKQ
jgi:hypothetical protein